MPPLLTTKPQTSPHQGLEPRTAKTKQGKVAPKIKPSTARPTLTTAMVPTPTAPPTTPTPTTTKTSTTTTKPAAAATTTTTPSTASTTHQHFCRRQAQIPKAVNLNRPGRKHHYDGCMNVVAGDQVNLQIVCELRRQNASETQAAGPGSSELRLRELNNHRNRYYSPYLGRWTSTDPIQFQAGDNNLYRYVGNGVVIGFDLWGLQENGGDWRDRVEPEQWRIIENWLVHASKQAVLVTESWLIDITADWLEYQPSFRQPRYDASAIVNWNGENVSTAPEAGGRLCVCPQNAGDLSKYYMTAPKISGEYLQLGGGNLEEFNPCNEGDVTVGVYHSHRPNRTGLSNQRSRHGDRMVGDIPTASAPQNRFVIAQANRMYLGSSLVRERAGTTNMFSNDLQWQVFNPITNANRGGVSEDELPDLPLTLYGMNE